MPQEVERKFLIKSDEWKTLIQRSIEIKQGYLSVEPERTVRARVIGEKGMITIKGKTTGITREEFEYEIPKSEAKSIITNLAIRPYLEKIRHIIKFDGLSWEIDEFQGENEGLLVAEVELDNPSQELAIPDWIGQEVSNDARYFNSNLIKHPFKKWSN